ncbi:YcjF family protein [Candidatus Synechococcus spongiarum]|uniref:YcjF family protein n=1 Tax=Candidatus Synechococcus spongiarum TaxID=431041 RepID=UPI0004712C00|nr:DUF697 domain-containing protein [Candidatus Synechococcus spongiarum]
MRKQTTRRLIWSVAVVLAALLALWMVITLLAGLAQGLQTLAGGWGVFLFLATVAALGWLGWITWRGWRPGGKSPRWAGRFRNPTLPIAFDSKREAAGEHLDSIGRQLELVRDQVMRQVLERERRQVAAELERGDLVVVVFGTGSSGKTSLIRALLGNMVGSVEPAMGSTRTSYSYRLPMAGLGRGVRLVDTPGILESGAQGQRREDMARRRAVQADLLLFVVDGDLRDSELRMAQLLLSLSKRLLLVLNKCDLLGQQQEQRLLQVLRQRCAPRLPAEDVVPVSSAPRPRGAGAPPPAPEVAALLRRLAQVLRLEGDELMADNILLQSRHLSVDTEAVLINQRQRDSRTVIERYAWIGGGIIALTPLPGLDLVGAAAVNAQMVLELGRIHGVKLDRDQGRELALAVGRAMTGLGLVKGGAMLLTTALSAAWPALVVAKALQGVSAAWLTRVAGASLMEYFSHNQDWGDGGMAAAIRKHYDLNRRQAQFNDFLTMAVERIVEPLQRRLNGLPTSSQPHQPPAPASVRSDDPE